MKIVVQIFIFTFLSTSCFSQTDFTDTTWFDYSWKVSAKTHASFYRIYKKTEKGFLVHDRYLNDKDQMVCEASKIKPELVKDGFVVYYYNGGVKEKQGYYTANKKSGQWTYYYDRGRDSSVTLYKLDGTQETLVTAKVGEVFTITEKPAEFPGGITAMSKFIQNYLEYPKICREKNIGGKVFLQFVVDEQGLISNVQIIKSGGIKELDDAAINVVKLMPTWNPAEMTGRKVKCYFNLPISFKITEDPFFIINSSNESPKYQEAVSAILEGKLQKAQWALESLSEDINALYNLGVVYLMMKERKKANKTFTAVKNRTDEKSQYNIISTKYLNNSI